MYNLIAEISFLGTFFKTGIGHKISAKIIFRCMMFVLLKRNKNKLCEFSDPPGLM